MSGIEIIYNIINTYTELLNSGCISENDREMVRNKIYQLQIVKVDLERLERLKKLLKENLYLFSVPKEKIYIIFFDDFGDGVNITETEAKLLEILGCYQEI